MEPIICMHCGQTIFEPVSNCPYCGRHIPTFEELYLTKLTKTKIHLFIALAIGALCSVLPFLGLGLNILSGGYYAGLKSLPALLYLLFGCVVSGYFFSSTSFGIMVHPAKMGILSGLINAMVVIMHACIKGGTVWFPRTFIRFIKKETLLTEEEALELMPRDIVNQCTFNR